MSRLAVLLLCVAGCDVGTPDFRGDGPSVHDSVPAAGSTDAPRLGPFRVHFDRRVIPRSVNRATVYVMSGTVRPLMSVRYDLLTQSAVLVPFDGTPLEPDVDYVLVAENVIDLDGVAQRVKYTARFHTPTELGPVPPAEPVATWADVEPILSAHCGDGSSGCHGPGALAVGLDLVSPAGVRRTAINVVAQTLPSGTATLAGAPGADTFSAMRILDVPPGGGHPETSYLMYTVLADRHVVDDPMPPAILVDPAAALNEEELRTLSAWITAGAPTP